MRKAIAVVIVVLLAGIAGLIGNGGKAKAVSPAVYQWKWSATNFYAEDAVQWDVDFLDTSVDYSWSIYETDFNGKLGTRLKTFYSTGVASPTLIWGGGGTYGVWPQDYTGPIVVIDNYGQIMSWHFLAPTPVDDWTTTSGYTSENLKQAPGGTQSTGDCKSAPYQDINADGYSHSYTACSQQVTTADGSFFLLHYRMDLVDYGDGDTIDFFPMGSSSANVEFNLDEIIDNNFGGYSGGLSEVNTQSFVVVNMGHTLLPFIDYDKSDQDFSTVAGNPHRASILSLFPLGAYNCIRYDGANPGTQFSDCESVLLVSNLEPFNRNTNSEFRIDVLSPEIISSGTVTARLSMATEAIYDVYSDVWDVYDDTDLVSTTVYSFASLPVEISGPAASTLSAIDKYVYWDIEPVSVFTYHAAASDYRFIPYDLYTLEPAETLTTGWVKILSQWGFNSDLGKLFVSIGAWMLGSGGCALIFKRNFLAHLIVFSFVGANLWIMKMLTPEMQLFFGMADTVLWVYFWGYAKQSDGGSVSNA